MVVVLTGAIVSAQEPAPGQGRGQGRGGGRGGAPQPPPTNLQVLPKDMSRPQVVMIMQQFNQALGVMCGHCHTFIGPNDPMNDFASDSKPEKNIARQMMLMVREINPLVQKGVAAKKAAADQVTQVNCMMCHRGAAIPVIPPPPAPAQAPAAPAAGRGNE
jgi:hypothetical protein